MPLYSFADFIIKLDGVEYPGFKGTFSNELARRPEMTEERMREAMAGLEGLAGKYVDAATARRIGESKLPADAQPIESNSPVAVRPIRFEVNGVRVSRSYGQPMLHVDFVVPDRKTGAPLTLTYNHAILPHGDAHYMAEQTSLAIRGAFEHEVREMLYRGDERAVEPHPENRPWPRDLWTGAR